MDDKLPRERSTGDWMHAISKGVVSAVPLAGGAAGEIFGLLVAAPASKRRDEWIQALAERLQALEKKIPDLFQALPSNDDFVTAALHATQIAMRTHQNEKIEALRNAVLNVAIGSAPNVDHQLMFLLWVDAFTPSHLAFLEICRSSCVPEQRAAVRVRLSQDRAFTDSVVNDLSTRGLLVDPRPYIARNRESSFPLVSMDWRLTALGHEFLAFIVEPAIPPSSENTASND